MSVLSTIRTLLSSVAGDSSLSILPFIPRPIRYLLVLVLLINSHSFPFLWHLRVFRPVIYLRLRYYALTLRGFSKKQKLDWLDTLSPVGENPFELVSSYSTWASPDDSDYNMHLSNSCYAKTIDSARLKIALRSFPAFYRAGGWTALGGTHYNFIREIPILASYEVRTSVASWDQKWLYVISRYVTKAPTSSKTAHKKDQKSLRDAETMRAVKDVLTSPSDVNPPTFSLHTPASGVPTPLLTSGTATPAQAASSSSPSSSSNLPSSPPAFRPESDGATVHCIAVSELCFKIGRITVPPALALACDGFCLSPQSEDYARVRALRRQGGGALKAFLAGGWRDVPESERWWDKAMASVEDRRKAGIEVVGKIREGLEGARRL